MKIFQSLIVCFCALLLGCAGGSDNDCARAAAAIGAMLPENEAGRDALDGMRLAAESLPECRGFSILAEPAPKSAADALRTVGRLSSDGVRVFCVGFDAEILAFHKIYSAMGGAFFNFLAEYPPATLSGENSTRIFFNGAQLGDMFSAKFDSMPRAKTAAIVSEDSDIGKSLGDYLNFCVSTQTRKIFRDFYSAGETKFDIYARGIVLQKPDAIFYAGSGAEFPFLRDSLRAAGYAGMLFEMRGIKRLSHDRSGGDPRTLCAFSEFEVSPNREAEKFAAAFEKKYGRAPSVFAAWGFESARLLASALAAADFDASKMRAFFKSRRYDGVLGTLYFDSSADCSAKLILR